MIINNTIPPVVLHAVIESILLCDHNINEGPNYFRISMRCADLLEEATRRYGAISLPECRKIIHNSMGGKLDDVIVNNPPF